MAISHKVFIFLQKKYIRLDMTDIHQITTHTKPFLKWAGGKGQLLPQLDALLPNGLDEREFTYIEPFVGGGVMLFHITHNSHNSHLSHHAH